MNGSSYVDGEHVAFMINGERVDIGSFSYGVRRDDDAERRVTPSFARYTFEATTSSTWALWSSLMEALYVPRRGASVDTLLRRARYGGRKGRSALRRLTRELMRGADQR